MKNNLFVSLCAFLILASVIGWSIPVRILVGANAVIILVECIGKVWRICHGRKEEQENENIFGSKGTV